MGLFGLESRCLVCAVFLDSSADSLLRLLLLPVLMLPEEAKSVVFFFNLADVTLSFMLDPNLTFGLRMRVVLELVLFFRVLIVDVVPTFRLLGVSPAFEGRLPRKDVLLFLLPPLIVVVVVLFAKVFCLEACLRLVGLDFKVETLSQAINYILELELMLLLFNPLAKL